MRRLTQRYYQRGDKVLIQESQSGSWAPGRVIGTKEGEYLKIAKTLTHGIIEGFRLLPVGTPVYSHVHCEYVRLIEHDPSWDPYTVTPFMTPDQYAILGGIPGFTGAYMGLMHVGAYMRGVDYDANDPAWAWDQGAWRPAVVIDGKRSWIAVRFADGYRSNGNRRSKSYRPAQIWPALCDHPEPVCQITIEKGWLYKSSSSGAMIPSPHLEKLPIRTVE